MTMKTTAVCSTLVAFIFVVGASGCGPDRSAEMPGSSSHAIQGGSNDTTHSFAVGIVAQVSGGQALCSGALLAPNLVATARHCVAAIPSDGVVECPNTRFGAVTAARNFVVTADADLSKVTTTVGVSKVITPSGSDQVSVCGHDIALLILSQNISLPSYVTPAIKPPITDHSAYSTTVTAIGYGLTSAADPNGDTAGVRRIKQQIKIACISNDKTFTDCLPSMGSDVTASEFVTGDGTCEGDSGSSAYDQANFDAGRWVTFGVLSRGGASGSKCLGGVYSRFDAWISLVTDAAMQAATMGGYAVPTWALSDDGGMAGPDGAVNDGGSGDGAASADASRDATADGPRDGLSSGTGGSGASGSGGASGAAGRDGGIATGSGGGGGTGGDGASGTGGGAARDAGSSSGTGGGSGGMNGGAISGSGGGPTTAHDGGASSDAADASQPGPGAGSGSGGQQGLSAVDGTVTGGCSCATVGGGPSSDDARRASLLGLGVALAAAFRRKPRTRRPPPAADPFLPPR